MPPALYALAIFWIRSCIHVWVSPDHNPPIYASHIDGMTGANHHTQFLFIEMGISQIFCLDWPQTTILPISTCQVARILGLQVWTIALGLLNPFFQFFFFSFFQFLTRLIWTTYFLFFFSIYLEIKRSKVHYL
jgi:hypothetical protein